MQDSSYCFFVPLCILLIYNLGKPFFSKDKSEIWSPITFVSLTLIYYVIKPSLGPLDHHDLGANTSQYQFLFYLVTLVFYVSLLIGFKRTKQASYLKFNSIANESNVQRFAIILFVIAMVCYIPFRGFRYTISADDAGVLAERTGFVSYFVDLISLFVCSCCLAIVGLKDRAAGAFKKRIVVYVIIYFTLVIFIVAGFRFRLVILLLAIATTYHLYPKPQKINYKVFVPIAIAAYLLFAVMDTARQYGAGINLAEARTLTLADASKGAGESDAVCCFSIITIDYATKHNLYYGIEPVVNAVFMPIPRAVFPWKPDGNYMRDIQVKVLGTSANGAAMLNYIEGYLSLGFLGVIIYGLCMGWLCKKIWSNYRNNPTSISALILLGIFNGFCYQWISRGYLGGNFNSFIYFVILPWWICSFINKRKKA